MAKKGTIFRNAGELMTLSGVLQKQGRKPLKEDLGVVKKKAFAVEDGKISWIGNNDKIPKAYKALKEVDLKKKNVFPGFIDCHTHFVFAGDRKHEFELRNQGTSYQEIANKGGGILFTVESTRKASEKKLTELAQQRVKEHLKQGVTTVEIKSGYGLNLKTEKKMLKAARALKGIQVVTTYLGAHAIPKEMNEESYLETLKEDLKIIKKNKLADRVDIFVEKNYFSKEKAKDYLNTAIEMGFKVTIHADQLNLTGGSDLAVELKAQSADHVICLDKKGKKTLAQSQTVAVLLPAADFYLQCDYPDARALIDQGGRVALATDHNPGSSPTQNISFVGLLARLKMKMSLPEVFAALTYNGACALGLENQRGSLTLGKQADFFITEKPWQNFFYSMENHQAEKTYIKGKAVKP